MFKKILVGCLALLMLVGCGGNNPITVDNFKPYFKIAADTFIATEQALNPTWKSATLVGDVEKLYTDWNSGASWQENAIVEVANINKDMNDIPNCDTQCVLLSGIFSGAVEMGLELAQNSQTQTGAKVAMKASKANGVVTYNTPNEYKKAWNKVAPQGHKL